MANKLTHIQNMIYEIRGQKVMLDSDLAALCVWKLPAAWLKVVRDNLGFLRRFQVC
jgi:hypothetical protein